MKVRLAFLLALAAVVGASVVAFTTSAGAAAAAPRATAPTGTTTQVGSVAVKPHRQPVRETGRSPVRGRHGDHEVQADGCEGAGLPDQDRPPCFRGTTARAEANRLGQYDAGPRSDARAARSRSCSAHCSSRPSASDDHGQLERRRAWQPALQSRRSGAADATDNRPDLDEGRAAERSRHQGRDNSSSALPDDFGRRNDHPLDDQSRHWRSVPSWIFDSGRSISTCSG